MAPHPLPYTNPRHLIELLLLLKIEKNTNHYWQIETEWATWGSNDSNKLYINPTWQPLAYWVIVMINLVQQQHVI